LGLGRRVIAASGVRACYALTLDDAWELVPGERAGDLAIRPRR
jgi:hypothetical protein